MLSQPISVSFDLGGGRQVSIETGKLARQADGSITVRQGNCVLLATVVANKDPKEGQDFFPLSVDYQEKFASAGRIPGSFFKREARLNDYEILTSRLIDRALRPLFPEDYLCDVQVLVSLISSDAEVLPDSLACLAASAALAVSDIPVKEIISEVRIARVNGQFLVNPTRSELAQSDLEFIIAATEKNLMMVEGEAKECSEADLIKALEIAHDAIRTDLRAETGDTALGQFGAFLQAQVASRSLTPQEGTSTDAILSRAEDALRQGDLDLALRHMRTLSVVAREIYADWLALAQARQAALSGFEALKAALSEAAQ